MARDLGIIEKIDVPVDRITMPEGETADRIVIANTHLLFTAKFKKAGADLVLTGEDGKKLVVTDYFKHARLPDLAAPGGAFLSGDLVERLAGPEHPGQYAQAGAPAGVPVIGRVERVGGGATVQHSNGVVEELRVGDNILQGDIVETRDGSTLGLSFIDGTAFNMGAGARMSINELVFDSNGTSNSAVFSLVRGAISFVAGQAARTGDMRVETPVATMGIRGTTVSTKSDIDSSNPVCTAVVDPTAMPETCVVSFSSSLLTDPDGHVGGFNLINRLTNTVFRSVTTTDTIVVITPSAGNLTSQVRPKSAEQVAQDLNDAQVLFPIFLSNPVNFNVNTPPQEIKPQGPSEHGSSTPPGSNTQTQQTTDQPIVLANSNGDPPAGNSNNSPPPPPEPSKTIVPPVIKFAPTVTGDSPPSLVEATGPGANPANLGTPTSIAHIAKSDQDGTATYDTTGWVSVGNGLFSQAGTFGTAFLDTNANTLTYQLDETKADPLGPSDHPTESFVIDVVDNDGQHATTTVVFTVDGRNDPPALSVATNSVSLDENTSVDISGTHVSDPEPTDDIATTFHVAHGTLTPLANGNFPGAGTDTITIHTTQSLDAVIAAGFRYTPDANYVGSDTLSIDVSDGHGGTQHQDIAITVNSTVGQPDTLPTTDPNGLEDVPEAVVLAGFDSNGTVTGFRITDVSGLHGTLFSDSNLTHPVNVGDIIPADFTQEGVVFVKPDANFNGDATFTFAAIDNDGKQDSTPATATVHFTSVNDPPVASDDIYTATAGQPLTSGNSVLDNDTDHEGDPLTAILASQPVFGHVVLNSDGTFVYTPNAGFTGSDFFGYYAFDGQNQSNLAFVDIAVNQGPNVPPQTDNVTASGNEDSVIAVTLSGNDSDGSVASFRITDLAGLSGVLYSDSNLTHQLSVNDLVSASGGSATVYFLPDQNINGSTSFGFAAHDDRGDDDATPATATVTVNPVNDPPSALDGVANATENQPFVGNVLATDIDSPTLFYSVSGTNGGAQHGTVAMGTGGAYVYTPDANFFANDTFFYTATDGGATSNIAHVDVTVAHANVAPETLDVTDNNGLEDVTEAVVFIGFDDDGTVTGFRITSVGGLHGTLYSDSNLTHQVNVGDIIPADFTQEGFVFVKPDADFNGDTSFTFAAIDNDGAPDASPATAHVHFAPVNDAPVAFGETYQATENQALIISALQGVLANDTDVDGNPLSASVAFSTQHGTLSLNGDGSFTYTPNAGFFGIDGFNYRAFDGSDFSNQASVQINVASASNVPPDTFDALSSGFEDQTIAVSLDGSDPDGIQSFRITDTSNLHGNIYSDSGLTHLLQAGDLVSVGSGGTATVYFRPDQDSSGTAQFNFAAVDGQGAEDPSPALATIDVQAVNDAPVFSGTSAGSTYLPGGSPVAVAANVLVADVDNTNFGGGSFVATITQGGHQGDILSIAGNAFISLNSTTVVFDADGAGGAFIPIVIGSVTDNLNSLEVDLNANADYAAIEALTQAVTFQNTTATPTSDTRTVTFTLVDGSGTADGGQDTGQFDAVVNSAAGTNQAPVSNNDFYSSPEDTTLNVSAPGVLANDTDAENDQLFAFELNGPAHGALTLMPDGSFFYSPDPGFVGTDTFTYGAFDGFSHGNPIISNNLIVNPDAETGPAASDFSSSVVPQGWNATGGFTVVTYAAGAVDPTFLNAADSAAGNPDGGLAYFSGGPNNAISSIFQIIDISDYGADIDLGLVQAILSADLGGYTGQEDNIVLTAHYLATANVSSELEHTILTGPSDQLRHDYATALSLPDATLLMPEGGFDVIPVGTRFIEIELTSNRASGNYNDGYADNLSLQLLDFASTGNVATVTVNVTGTANTPPVVTLPGSLIEISEDTPVDLVGASVVDPDAGDVLTATITATHGALTPLGNLGAGSGITLIDADGSDGSLTIEGPAAAINAAIAAGVTYTPDPDYNNTPVTPDHVTVAVSDNHGGSDSKSIDIIVDTVNDAPVLANDAPPLNPITSNDVNNAGQSVASILGSDVTDPDGPGAGIAITGVTTAHGHWEYQLDGIGSWTTISASDDAALLLRDVDFVRFVPNPGSGGIDGITYHAWDQSDGLSPEETADLTNPANVGGSNAYRDGADTATIEISVPANSPPSVDIVGTFGLIEFGVDANNFPIGVSNQQLELIVSDPDTGDTTSLDPTGWFQSGPVFTQEGAYGALIFDSNEAGMLSYQLSDSNPLTQVLKAGQHVTDEFNVTFVDQHGAPTTQHVVVDITGSNDAPVTEGDKIVAFDSNDLSPIDLRIATPTDYENDALTVQIAAVPIAGFGQILLDGNPVAAGATLTPAELARLQFQSSSAGNGGTQSALTYSVSDPNGGITTNTVTLSDSEIATQSGTLNFDDPGLTVTPPNVPQIPLPSGYGTVGTFDGFFWSLVGAASNTNFPNPFSAPNFAWGLSSSISSVDGTEFAINSVELGRFSGAHFVRLTGYTFDFTPVGTVTYDLGATDFTSNWLLTTPNFGPITRLDIQGLDDNGNATSLAFWKMDDFSFTTVHDILGGFGSDILVGGTVDDRFHGSFNNDTFVYATGGHADTILDFAQGLDRVSLQGVTSVHSMADLGSLASQQDADTFIDFGNGDTLTLKNVDLNSLNDNDFLFSPGITGDLTVQLVKGGSVKISSLDLQQIEGSDPNLTFTVERVQHGHLVRTDTSQTLAVGDHFTQSQIDAGTIAFAADDTTYTGTGAGFKVSLSDGLVGSQPATVTVTAAVLDAQINISTNSGVDFDVEDPIAKMGAGVVTPDVADPTHKFTILNQAANRDFSFVGSGFTYSGSGNAIAVTGGVLLAMLEFDHATHAQIMEVTLNVPAAAWYNAAVARAAGDESMLEAVTDNWSVAFVGAGGIDAFQSGNGQDFFTSSGGNDLIDGGENLDRVSYANATGPIDAQLADGVVTGDASVGTDTLRSIEFVSGTAFADTFNAGPTALNPGGFNQISTNAGSGSSSGPNFNDFEGRGGNDSIIGNGSTRVSYLHATSAVTVDIAAGTADGDASVGHDTFSGVNQVRGSSYADHLFGSDNAFQTFENFDGRGGDDVIDGRGGFDRSVYLFDGGPIDVQLAAGSVTGGPDTGTDVLQSIEAITGTNFNDVYNATGFTGSGDPAPSVNSGNSGNPASPGGTSSNLNEFEGAGGDDTVTGNGNTRVAFYNATDGVVVSLNANGSGVADGASSGHDTYLSGVNAVRGSEFNDIIQGSTQSETLEGRGGDDVLDGRGGNDRLVGGSGADIFAYDSLGNYRIDDFNRGEGDRMDLRGAGIASIAGLTLNRGTFANSTFTLDANGSDTQILGFGSGKSINVLGQIPASFSPSDFIFTNTVAVSVHTTDGWDFGTLYDDMAASSAQQTQNTTTHLFAVDAAKGITFEMVATNGSPFVLDVNHLPTSGTIGEINILDTTNLNDPTLLSQSHILVSTNGWIMPAASLFNAVGEYASANPAIHTQGLTDLNNIFNAGKYSIVGSSGSQSNNGTPHDGADVFFGSNGADVFNGLGGPFGPGDHGSDTVDYSHATATVTANLQTPASNTGAAQGDIYISIENLRGSNFNDALTGDGNNNVLEGGLGTNTLDGGGGNDTASYEHAASAVTVSLVIGGAQNTIGAGTDTLTNIQNLLGSNFDDHLTGNSSVNFLTGGHGNDTLTGSGGNDTFVFVNGDGHDTIADFISGQDKIDLTDGHTTAQVQALIDATTAGSNTLDLQNGTILTFTGVDVHNQLHAATDFLVH